MRPVYDEAEARWCDGVPRIFFEAELEANNYEAEASCLLLLQDVCIPDKNLENI